MAMSMRLLPMRCGLTYHCELRQSSLHVEGEGGVACVWDVCYPPLRFALFLDGLCRILCGAGSSSMFSSLSSQSEVPGKEPTASTA